MDEQELIIRPARSIISIGSLVAVEDVLATLRVSGRNNVRIDGYDIPNLSIEVEINEGTILEIGQRRWVYHNHKWETKVQ